MDVLEKANIHTILNSSQVLHGHTHNVDTLNTDTTLDMDDVHHFECFLHVCVCRQALVGVSELSVRSEVRRVMRASHQTPPCSTTKWSFSLCDERTYVVHHFVFVRALEEVQYGAVFCSMI